MYCPPCMYVAKVRWKLLPIYVCRETAMTSIIYQWQIQLSSSIAKFVTIFSTFVRNICMQEYMINLKRWWPLRLTVSVVKQSRLSVCFLFFFCFSKYIPQSRDTAWRTSQWAASEHVQDNVLEKLFETVVAVAGVKVDACALLCTLIKLIFCMVG